VLQTRQRHLSVLRTTIYPGSVILSALIHFTSTLVDRHAKSWLVVYAFCGALQDRCVDCTIDLSFTWPVA